MVIAMMIPLIFKLIFKSTTASRLETRKQALLRLFNYLFKSADDSTHKHRMKQL